MPTYPSRRHVARRVTYRTSTPTMITCVSCSPAVKPHGIMDPSPGGRLFTRVLAVTSGTAQTSTVDAPIVSVTVFPNLARITRRGSVDLAPGRHRVFIEPLPLRLSADSVRVGGQG